MADKFKLDGITHNTAPKWKWFIAKLLGRKRIHNGLTCFHFCGKIYVTGWKDQENENM